MLVARGIIQGSRRLLSESAPIRPEVIPVRRLLVTGAALGLLALSTLQVPNSTATPAAPLRGPLPCPTLPDVDIRTALISSSALLAPDAIEAAAVSKSDARRTQVAELQAVAPGLQIRWSALTSGPRLIVPATGAVTEARTGTPADIGTAFIRANAALYGLDEADLAGLELVRNYVSSDTGVTHLQFVQKANGIRVYGADLRMAVDTYGRVVWAGGELVPSAVSAAKADAWTLDASEASVAAARTIGVDVTPSIVASKGGPEDLTVVELGPAFTEPATARRLLFPIAPGVTVPAWNLLLAEKGPGNLYVVTVDARNGKLLARHNLTRYGGTLQDSKFLVFTGESPQPNTPFSTSNPRHVERVLVTPGSSILDASPSGWVGSQAVTIGNNVRAVEDRDANNSGGLPATGDAAFNFSPALDNPINTGKPNTEAAIVNLFYWNNFIHDYLFRLGFDEAAGNFQAVNSSGQGRGNDAVNADAQDGGGTNNANFGTPPDGGPPRMQMYLWSGGYDGSFDQSIVIHEYCHGLSTRLIGGPDYVDGLTGPQSGGMGEGWSDWYGLTILAPADAPLDANYVVGGYATRDFNSGVRNFPYTTKMTVNPLTYADIDPTSGNIFNDPTEVHNVGEVWCATLWEMRANFITAYGPAAGKALCERLVTDGMKYSLNNPSFCDARDGILIADQVRTGGANQCLIWQGFAKRGVGYGAFSLNGSATTVKESYELPPWCESEGQAAFSQKSYAEDDTIVRISVGDADLAAQSTVNVTVTSTSGDSEPIVVGQAAGIPGLFQTNLLLRRGSVTTGNNTLDVALGDTVTVTYQDATGNQARTGTARVVRRVDLLSDSLEQGETNWKAGQFKLTTERSASPTHSWTDSPGTNYADNTNYRLQLKTKFDLSNGVGSRLVFKQSFATEPGYDLCIVEAKAKGSPAWRTIAVFSGSQTGFESVSLDLSEFDGKTKVVIRFSLITDPFVNDGGWWIDDVKVQTGRTN